MGGPGSLGRGTSPAPFRHLQTPACLGPAHPHLQHALLPSGIFSTSMVTELRLQRPPQRALLLKQGWKQVRAPPAPHRRQPHCWQGPCQRPAPRSHPTGAGCHHQLFSFPQPSCDSCCYKQRSDRLLGRVENSLPSSQGHPVLPHGKINSPEIKKRLDP